MSVVSVNGDHMQNLERGVAKLDSADTPVEMYSLNCRGREIQYGFSPAESINAPILVVFHGQAYNAIPAKFKSPSWNVICPMDRFGYGGMGSWYLGEAGDFFWLDAIPELLQQIRRTAGTGRLYMWGSSMGGYAAILHGTLNSADSIYANIPQTVLLGSQYAKNGSAKYFEPIFGGSVDGCYNDLKNLIKTRNRTKYFLCFNQLEAGNYFAEQGLAFVGHLNGLRIKTYLEVRPLAKHGVNHTIAEALALFKKYSNV